MPSPCPRSPSRSFALLLALAAVAAHAAPPRTTQTAVAEIDGAAISVGELATTTEAKRLEMERQYQDELAAMRVRYERARASLEQGTLNALVNARVVEREARATRRSAEAVRAEAISTKPTEAEARAFYERERAAINAPFEQVAPMIYNLLARQSADAAAQALYDRLRAKYHARIIAEPMRETVAATGPSRGPAGAAVTIVEFGDFQCPFCARARGPLADLVAAYPTDVRLVFRQLPLTDIHAQAQGAAEASLCADEQGKFWEFHDAVYAAQGQLDPATLRATALGLGVDGARFDECLASGRTRTRITTDVSAARTLAVDGTPGLFINGRFYSGAQPLEVLKQIVNEELARRGRG